MAKLSAHGRELYRDSYKSFRVDNGERTDRETFFALMEDGWILTKTNCTYADGTKWSTGWKRYVQFNKKVPTAEQIQKLKTFVETLQKQAGIRREA